MNGKWWIVFSITCPISKCQNCCEINVSRQIVQSHDHLETGWQRWLHA
uniref:Uncharacterized protein n=1 Tax=Rhizophora mucronata TaxID=61149 RepID=A0A2P2PQI1_RHIMU